jgi:hypothetical protein
MVLENWVMEKALEPTNDLQAVKMTKLKNMPEWIPTSPTPWIT